MLNKKLHNKLLYIVWQCRFSCMQLHHPSISTIPYSGPSYSDFGWMLILYLKYKCHIAVKVKSSTLTRRQLTMYKMLENCIHTRLHYSWCDFFPNLSSILNCTELLSWQLGAPVKAKNCKLQGILQPKKRNSINVFIVLDFVFVHVSFEVLLWWNSQYPFFSIFVHNRSLLDILPNFNLLRALEFVIWGPLFPRIYSRHYFSLFQILLENLIKWHHFLKNTAWVKIIITINVENCTNIWRKVFVILYANCCLLFLLFT